MCTHEPNDPFGKHNTIHVENVLICGAELTNFKQEDNVHWCKAAAN
jgi:hypothetical protein